MKSKLRTTTKSMGDGSGLLPPVTPGDILKEELIDPLGLTIHSLALKIQVPANRILAIVNGQRAISADTALRLGRYFGMSPKFWLNLQQNYDLEIVRRQKKAEIEAIVPRSAA
ncbi:MAG TPA: HigA family addiction module antitoxin [Bryobacteraceae bacterium]|nr:HigA family addiction module antitoxin [Bryobacteraceae bacterium]